MGNCFSLERPPAPPQPPSLSVSPYQSSHSAFQLASLLYSTLISADCLLGFFPDLD